VGDEGTLFVVADQRRSDKADECKHEIEVTRLVSGKVRETWRRREKKEKIV
jgi:hypothetical protein